MTVRRAGAGEAIFLEAARRSVGMRVPAHLREQLMVELMTPDSLFALLDHVLTLNEQRPDEANDRSRLDGPRQTDNASLTVT